MKKKSKFSNLAYKIYVLTAIGIFFLCYSCKTEPKLTAQDVVAQFKEASAKRQILELKVRRIDTFPGDGVVWNNTGNALIEKDDSDDVFGFSYFGFRDDIPSHYIYDKGYAFEIDPEKEQYEVDKGHFGVIGTPGGQMVPPNIFRLDSVYKTISLAETDSTYVLNYTFEDDPNYSITNIKKRVTLNKEDLFPLRYERTSYMLEDRSATQMQILRYRINEEVKVSIATQKEQLVAYSLIEPGDPGPNPILTTKAPQIALLNVVDKEQLVSLSYDKLTLLDFWEVWCGPCIKSFPKVEELSNKYGEDLQVVGIVTRDSDKAVTLIEKKGVTFQNLIGTKELSDTFSVNSWPRYFLIDKNGIVQKEYHGFSKRIEADIKNFLGL